MCHWVCAEQNKMVGFVLECLLLIIAKVNSSPIMSCMVFVTLILQYMYNYVYIHTCILYTCTSNCESWAGVSLFLLCFISLMYLYMSLYNNVM